MQSFLERRGVPVFQNVLFKYRTDALNVERGDLYLFACSQCGFVFNAAFDPAATRYGEQYDNNQTCSGEFSSYMAGHIRRIAEASTVRDTTVVEVGCGNGRFLERLIEAMPNAKGFGFDPAYRGPSETTNGRIRYLTRYFGTEDAKLQADLVVCRHVIEHVVDPVRLLISIRQALRASKQPRVFVETPCVEWILRNQVVWDFFYEHCSYFSSSSLQTAFNRAGFRVERVEHVFGGQYLWLEATPADADVATTMHNGKVPGLAHDFAQVEPKLVAAWQHRATRLRERGRVAVWGAGAKGVTFLNLADPEAIFIDCAIDIDPQKQHRFVGGTGHSVVGVGDLVERGIASAVLMNPNYKEENRRLLLEANADLELIDEPSEDESL